LNLAQTALRYLLRVIALLILLGSIPTTEAQENDFPGGLTQEERAFLKAHPVIRVGGETDWAPYDFVDSSGRHAGIAADYLSIIEDRLGVQFEVRTGPSWTELLDLIRAREIDLLPAIWKTADREKFLEFTLPYAECGDFIFVREDRTDVQHLEDLRGRRVASVKGFATRSFIEKQLGQIRFIESDSILGALRLVIAGEADAFVGEQGAVNHVILQSSLTGLKIAGDSGLDAQGLHMAVRGDWPILQRILQKTLDSIPSAKRREILRGWISLEPAGSGTAAQSNTPLWVWALVFLLASSTVILVWKWKTLSLRAGEVNQSGSTAASLYSWPILVMAIAAIAGVIGLTWWTQSRQEARAREDVGDALQTVMETTSSAVDYWIREREEEVRIWAGHLDIRRACLRLLEEDAPALASSAHLAELREQLSSVLGERGYLGFLLVGRDGSVVGGDSDGLLGRPSTEVLRPAFLERVLRSSHGSELSLPRERRGQVSMVVAASIADLEGETRAVLCLLIDPETDFTQILQRGRIGESGESYAFNQQGQLISESRFDDDLREIGLIGDEQRGILNVQIRDPGGNLLEGHEPSLPREQMSLTLMATNAVAGRSGLDLDGYHDYRGVPVLGAWTWDPIHRFGIATEIDVAEAYASLRASRRLAVLTAAFTVLLIGLLTGLFLRSRRLLAAAGEKWTRQILENALDAVVMMDAGGRVTYWSPQAETMFGYASGSAIGQSLGELIVPVELRERHEAGFRRVIATSGHGSSRKRIETRALHRSGREFPVELTILPMKSADGWTFSAFLRDLTEQKRVEAEIEKHREHLEDMVQERTVEVRQQKEMLENTLESLTHPFYVVNAEDYSIVLANSAARSLGIRDKAKCHQLTHRRDEPCDGEHDPCPLKEVVRTKQAVMVEHIHFDADGNRIYVEVHGYPVFDDDGNVVQMIEYSHDISERKRMEETIREAQEAAESANRAKSAFLANMSHELRTPMNAIIGYSEMLAEDAEDEGYDEMVPDLGKITAAGRHLLALINDILDLSKIEAGRMDLYLERFDLAEMLTEAASTVAPLIDQNANRLVTEFPADLGSIRADLTKVRQALFNLLSNAAKFTKEGTVTLSARRETTDEGDRVYIAVSDTGIGIPEDKFDQVFQEFSQADGSTTRQYGGTGLGLPISRRFCQMMGGDILVASTTGEGSTFTLALPAEVDAMEAARAAAELGADAQVEVEREELPDDARRPVLVIDDDEDARELLKRTLKKDGHLVVAAASGAEGLERARELRPILITLDVMMPGMDGWAVLKELKADPTLRDVPVVMVTIVNEQGLGYSLGAVEYLTKPIDREAIKRVVAKFADEGEDQHALIVEDNEVTRDLFRRALEDHGWHVSEAANGALGLEEMEARTPDLILLDLMMPVMDGFEFVLELRARDEWRETPVIVVTAKDLTDEDRHRLSGLVEQVIEKGAHTRDEIAEEVRACVAEFAPPETRS
jgi:PAS domain S-box-containing protein